MSTDRLKQCPTCRTLAPIDTGTCVGCGHVYRTRFAPAPAPLSQTLPDLELPLPPASRLLSTGVPPPPAPRIVSHLPDPRSVSPSLNVSPSYAIANQRLPWIKAGVALLILYRVVSFLVHAGHLFRH